jgi:hypothetical protein
MSTEISPKAPDDPVLLTCWKDIANYLGKGVRTVQRWEQEFGLPVFRPNGADHKSAVIAHTKDLDEWLESHWSLRNNGHANNAVQPPNGAANSLILNSRELRSAHSQLIHETTKALAALVSSCRQLALTEASLDNNGIPPR